MHRQDRKHIAFITRFVESVTVRPFMEDLRRASAARAIFTHEARTSVPARETTVAA